MATKTKLTPAEKARRAMDAGRSRTAHAPTSTAKVSGRRTKATVALEADEYKILGGLEDGLKDQCGRFVGHSELFRCLLAEMSVDADLRSRVEDRVRSGEFLRPRGGAVSH